MLNVKELRAARSELEDQIAAIDLLIESMGATPEERAPRKVQGPRLSTKPRKVKSRRGTLRRIKSPVSRVVVEIINSDTYQPMNIRQLTTTVSLRPNIKALGKSREDLRKLVSNFVHYLRREHNIVEVNESGVISRKRKIRCVGLG